MEVVAQDSPDDIRCDIVPGMPEVGVIIDSRPTNIPGNSTAS